MEAVRKTVSTKWAATVASIWIQATSGSLYTFSIYSQTLKSTQGYSQSTLDTISVSKDFGANCGILSGVLYSAAVSSAGGRSWGCGGPWVVHLAGAAQSFAGYFLIWAAVEDLIPRPPVAVMCLFMLMAAHAQSFFNTADVVTAVRNFPGYSGTAVGIMKGFIGLSGAILIQVYRTIFNNKPAAFLLMLALLPTLNSLLLMSFVRVHGVAKADDLKHLNSFSLISMIIAAYLMVVIILEEILSLHFVLQMIAFLALLLLLASPLCVAVRAEGDYYQEPKYVGEHEDDPVRSGYNILSGDGNQGASIGRDNVLDRGEDRDLLQAVRTIDFWLLFIAMACGMGSGLAMVNNLSQIGGSLGYKSYEISTMISLWSIWNFLGRFGGIRFRPPPPSPWLGSPAFHGPNFVDTEHRSPCDRFWAAWLSIFWYTGGGDLLRFPVVPDADNNLGDFRCGTYGHNIQCDHSGKSSRFIYLLRESDRIHLRSASIRERQQVQRNTLLQFVFHYHGLCYACWVSCCSVAVLQD